ncbi:class E sortase [Oscillospiraceae bacterium PP1C4]
MNRLPEWVNNMRKKWNIRAVAGIALLVLGIMLVGYHIKASNAGAWLRAEKYESSVLQASSQPLSQAPQSQEESSAPPQSEIESSAPSQPVEEEVVYPTDVLFITLERESYVDGAMVLRVPRLELETPVMDGTDEQALKKGVGLYEYAQTPGEGNCNVSIAGHRDIHGCEFYNIDKVTDGDLLYLEYNGMLYTYQYKQTEIVQADDWSPIYCKTFSCLTLTSCHPIGTSQKRIIVTAELVSSAEL